MLPGVFMHKYRHHNRQKAAFPKSHRHCARLWKEPGQGFHSGTQNHELTQQSTNIAPNSASHKQCGVQPLHTGLGQTLSVLTKAGSFSILISREGKGKHR